MDIGDSPLLTTIRNRRSCRAYRPEPLPADAVQSLFEAARLAPSACNKQPWRFVAVTDAATRGRIVAEGFLPGLRMDWALQAPLLVVLGMQRDVLTHRVGAQVSGVDYPWIDVGIAGEHLVLRAEELGWGTCWIGWIRPRVIRRIVDWPRAVRPVCVISVGWPEGPRPEARLRLPMEAILKEM